MPKAKSGIPTIGARGILFRSRLEAQWAAFFDLLHWSWEYEPFDLEGYIPDFILTFQNSINVLVEIKGTVLYSDLKQYTPKIADSGWKASYLVLGAKIWKEAEVQDDVNYFSHDNAELSCLGITGPQYEQVDENTRTALSCPAILATATLGCRCTGHTVLTQDSCVYSCAVCGSTDDHVNRDLTDWCEADALFMKARNAVQWKPKRKRRRYAR